MIKFRQFIVESKKKLTPKELHFGVATHFAHSENRKKKLKEDDEQNIVPEKTLHDGIKEHLKNRPANPHLGDREEAGDDLQAVVKHMEHHYDFKQAPHQNEIKKYTEGSGNINRYLYNGSVKEGRSHKELAENRDGIKEIDQAVAHHTLTHPLTVFSGVTQRVPEDAAKHPDRLVHHPGYISTSLSAHVAAGFTKEDSSRNRHVVRLHLEPGHKMLPILHHSDYSTEREILVGRGHTLKLSEKPETHDITNGWKNVKLHIWDAHIHKAAD